MEDKTLTAVILNLPPQEFNELAEKSKLYLAALEARPARKKRYSGWKARLLAALGGGALALTGTLVHEALGQGLAQTPVAPVNYEPNKIFAASNKPAISPISQSPQTLEALAPYIQLTPTRPAPSPTPFVPATPTARPRETPASIPTPEPTKSAQEIVGKRNLAEYFLDNLVELFKQKRVERYHSDPAFAERINPDLLNNESINLVYLGIDNTRERPREFNIQGWGRADVIIFTSFNPRTLQTLALTLPRDLFAPELTRFQIPEGWRINGVTMVPMVDPSIDSFELVKQIIETATGTPVDGVIQTNVDFMQGYGDMANIFDSLFPRGLSITVPQTIVDPAYPAANYGTKILRIEKGEQVMNGRGLTEYARSRNGTSDFDRSKRQREVLNASLKTLLPALAADLIKGETTVLDNIIAALETQQVNYNLYYDINIVEILRSIREGLTKLRSSPQGLAALSLMAANSAGDINNTSFTSLGLTRGNLLANVTAGERYFWAYELKPSAQSTAAPPTSLGNYLRYWEQIRLWPVLQDKLREMG